MADAVSGNNGRYRLIGSNGSPYSMKLRAIMRYRRLPFDWVLRTDRNRHEVAHIKPALIPILRYPDGAERVDSTPIAYDLEARHPGRRSIVPDDPGNAFLSHLIEDMADEWCTKMMFHYRWAYAADIDYAGLWIADDFFPDLTGAARAEAARDFANRQIGRMALVGCTPENAPIIEETYGRLLALLEGHVGLHAYLFGSRPALADFGLFGQLKTLATDPTPMAIMRETAQRTESWLRQLDDASGIEGEWLPADAALPDATVGLLRMAGEVYLPFLAANAAAIRGGREGVELKIGERPYAQGVFGYQSKCLDDLRRRLRALEGEPLRRTRALLEETGCWDVLAATD